MTTKSTATIEAIDKQIDAIHFKHPKDSHEYNAILRLNTHLLGCISPNRDRAAARASVKEVLSAAQDQPTLYRDMVQIVELFMGMIDVAIAEAPHE